jgi:CrcB protein
MKSYFLVFIGGGLGSVARYAVSLMFRNSGASAFPMATLSANAASSLILGMMLGYLEGKSDQTSTAILLFLGVGFCGGFSTFSTFSYETLLFLRSGQLPSALLNAGANLIVCISLAFAGYQISR